MGTRLVAVALVVAWFAACASAAGAAHNGRIAFSRDGELYTVNPDGSGLADIGPGVAPAWSPDGTRIAFLDRPGSGAGAYVANADGSGRVRVGDGTESVVQGNVPAAPAWSPDGTRVAVVAAASLQAKLEVANADGSAARVIYNDARPGPLSWSPDGALIAFTAANEQDVAVIRPDGTGFTRLIADAAPDSSPSWSPDGSKLAFYRGGFGGEFPYVMRPDGSGLRQLSTSPFETFTPWAPQWSPDGQTLAFTIKKVAAARYGYIVWSNVASIRVDGTDERVLTNSPAFLAGDQPVWSPDGSQIAYVAGGVGLMNADGSCETPLVAGGSQPAWQPVAGAPAPSLPLQCVDLGLTGSLGVDRERPRLDAARIYVETLTVSNDGNLDATDVRLTSNAATGTEFLMAKAERALQCELTDAVDCILGTLAPGESTTLVLSFRVHVRGRVDHRFGVSTSARDSDPSDNSLVLGATFPFCDIAGGPGLLLVGTLGDDLICGTIGRDVIHARGGEDIVRGGPGNDVIDGGAGADVLRGEEGRDRIYGRDGNDVIVGGSDKNRLFGGNGNDRIGGGFHDDFIVGGPGNDRVFGSFGNDTIRVRDGRLDNVECGPGRDVVFADYADAVLRDCEHVVRRAAP